MVLIRSAIRDWLVRAMHARTGHTVQYHRAVVRVKLVSFATRVSRPFNPSQAACICVTPRSAVTHFNTKLTDPFHTRRFLPLFGRTRASSVNCATLADVITPQYTYVVQKPRCNLVSWDLMTLTTVAIRRHSKANGQRHQAQILWEHKETGTACPLDGMINSHHHSIQDSHLK